MALLAWCLLPLWLFRGEKLVRTPEGDSSASLSSMMVGRMDLVTGLVYSTQAMQEEDPEERMRLIAAGGFQTLGPLLAPEERVLALGNATPFLSTRGYEYATVCGPQPLDGTMHGPDWMSARWKRPNVQIAQWRMCA